jgi:hypothetical protein
MAIPRVLERLRTEGMHLLRAWKPLGLSVPGTEESPGVEKKTAQARHGRLSELICTRRVASTPAVRHDHARKEYTSPYTSDAVYDGVPKVLNWARMRGRD